MELNLKNKRVLITGGSKGIGLACAEAFCQEGAYPILISRSIEGLEAAALSLTKKFGIEPAVHAVDLSKHGGVDKTVSVVGNIDVLINNAGAIPGGTLDKISDELWRSAWELKLFGYINLTRAYLQRMRERKQGVIVNIIGMAGVNPKADYICGAVANAGLTALTHGLGGESTRDGVRIMGINPGQTQTERTVLLAKQRAASTLGDEHRWEELMAGLPFGRLMHAREVADMAAFLASDRAGYMSGSVIDMDGGQRYASAKK